MSAAGNRSQCGDAGVCREEQATNISAAFHERVLLTFQEAGRLLCVSARTVRRMVAGGDLPEPIKVRGSSRLVLRDIESYVDRQTTARDRQARGAS